MADSTPFIPATTGDERKQGHTIFFCCCDSKKGVQIFNTLGIISAVVMMLLLSINKYGNVEVDGNADTEEAMKDLRDDYIYYMIAYGVGLAIYILVIIGASMYSSCLVSLAILYSLFNLASTIYFGATEVHNEQGWMLGFVIWPIISSLLFIYPHAVFISEVNRGIMSPKSYARERASLCCV